MTTFIDMAKSPEEISRDYPMGGAAAKIGQPMYPYGLCIRLGTDELAKLDLATKLAVGDIIDMRCFAKVTGVSENSTTDGTNSNVELQITQMAVENEADEDGDEEAGEPVNHNPLKLGRRNPYK